MATLPYVAPNMVGQGQQFSPTILPYTPAPFAAFRRGALLQLVTAGAIVTQPGGVGTLAATAGPVGFPIFLSSSSATSTVGNVTIAGSASSGAPAATYYAQLTYRGASTAESLAGPEFIVSCAAGVVPSINVLAAGSPALATGFNVYASYYPSYEARQNAAASTLATPVVLTNPLTNSVGVAGAATNAATGILGMALDDSNAVFYSGSGNSANIGNQSLFGSTMTVNPLAPNEAFQVLVEKLTGGVFLEMSLVQPWNPALVGSAVAGITLDPLSGFYVADTSQSNKILNIVAAADGAPTFQGVVGDIGKRVIVQFIPSSVA